MTFATVFAVVLAIVPVALLIGLGGILRRIGFLAETFWSGAEKLAYFVLLPALFLHGLAMADFSALPVFSLGVVLLASLLIGAVLLVAAGLLSGADGPALTSIFQGGIRFNNYVGVPIAAGLYGLQGVALAALANAVIVPTVNVLCVLVFARYGAAPLSWRGVARQLVTNPLLVSCLAGIALQVMGWRLPPGLEGFLRVLGQAALPIGLLCVGAALDPGAARLWAAPVALSSLFKFGILPVLALIAALALELKGPVAVTAVLFQALPTASSSYILARQLGGDAPLMAGITAAQTLLAAVMVPLALAMALMFLG